MSDGAPLHDYSHSRAVIMGTWDYEFLKPIPAAENSMQRIIGMLTGPLCAWPENRLLKLPNERRPNDIPDQLVTAFEDIHDVALFYYVGHGQIDPDDQLCLGLIGSRPEPNRRPTTSLKFADVRQALLGSPAATKIVILDCCFSGLASRPASTLSGLVENVLDMMNGTGAYTMAATSAYTTAWYEDDQQVLQPQTFFTKYLVDLVDSGIPGRPSKLSLDTLYKKLHDNLTADKRPSPQNRVINSARDFVFAYNAAPKQSHLDPDLEIAELKERLQKSEAAVAAAQDRIEKAQAQMEALLAGSAARAEELAFEKDNGVAEARYSAYASSLDDLTREHTRARAPKSDLPKIVISKLKDATNELPLRPSETVTDKDTMVTSVGRSFSRSRKMADHQLPSLAKKDRNEKYLYVQSHAWINSTLSISTFLILLFGQALLILRSHWFWPYATAIVFGAALLGLPWLTDSFGRKFSVIRHQKLVDSWRPETYPTVDIFLPVYGESAESLRDSWGQVAMLCRHYKGTVTPYVLDDSGSSALREMAREFGFAYATRPNRGWFKKSGNLWFGFQVSYGDYILLLDAYFSPQQDLLDETLPYMDAYPDTGIVQTPQTLRNASWTGTARATAVAQTLFYKAFRTTRARTDGSMCVGSCSVYRRAALVGNLGMTLAGDFEDVLTGFDLQSAGWRSHYVPVALSDKVCPDNVPALLNQQYRWCSGTASLVFSRRFWNTKIPLYTRVRYISSFIYYIYTSLLTFVLPVLAIAILAFAPRVLTSRSIISIVPVLLYCVTIIPWWHKAPYHLNSWATVLVSSWAHLFAYWDLVRGKRLTWPQFEGQRQDGYHRFWVCFGIWSAGSSLAWGGLASWRMLTIHSYSFVVLLILGLFELVVATRVFSNLRLYSRT